MKDLDTRIDNLEFQNTVLKDRLGKYHDDIENYKYREEFMNQSNVQNLT